MKRRAGLGIALIVCAAAEAAEPAAVAPPAQLAPRAAITPATQPASPVAKPSATKPLELRIGNVRRYMPPEEYRAALDAPDADKNTVVVEAQRELLPVKYDEPIPPGLLMAPIWALMNPKESWRILLPDINHAPIPPPDVVPPPIFRWGP